MRIKICGITSLEDARMVAQAGADAIGLNFVVGPRRITLDTAERILAVLPPFVMPVALVDVTGGQVPDPLADVLARHRVSHVQMYGAVTPTTIGRLQGDGVRPILVHRVLGEEFPAATQALLDHCATTCPAAILLDACDEIRQGGTGRTWDWGCVARARQDGLLRDWPPIVVAGGLTPENVAQAIAVVRPWGVDVSSGVEDAPGRKSAEKVHRFIEAVRQAVAS